MHDVAPKYRTRRTKHHGWEKRTIAVARLIALLYCVVKNFIRFISVEIEVAVVLIKSIVTMRRCRETTERTIHREARSDNFIIKLYGAPSY